MATKTKVTKTTKTTTKAVKTAPKASAEKAPAVAAPKKSEKISDLNAVVVGVDGKTVGHMALPAELFDVKVNKALLAQTVRVYLANQRAGSAHTKTRGEVEGSSRKIYKQKGTGRARHGGIRAPIFVGGGISFGPQAHSFTLHMSKSMKRGALASALTEKFKAKNIIVVDGLEALEPKTKAISQAMTAIGATGKVLFAVQKGAETLVRSARNIAKLDVSAVTNIHPYAIMTHHKVIFTKKALEEAKAHFIA